VATGIETWCVRKKLALGSNFTSGQFFKAPHSEYVSIWLYLTFKFKWERCSSWFVTEDCFSCLDRLTAREIFLNISNSKKESADRLSLPWIGYITTSYKKHGLINCKLNQEGQNIWVFENRLVDASNHEKMKDWWLTLNHYLRLGFSRPILESGSCPPFLIQKLGFKNWVELQSWMKNKYLSSLYSLLLYFLPSQEEIKNGVEFK
jgi:hypothetical protein